MWPETDRRDESRVPLEVPVDIRDEEDFDGTAKDLSTGGLRIEIDRELPIAREVEVSFELPETDGSVAGSAKVKWCKRVGAKSEHTWVVGLMFTSVADEDRGRLDEYLRERRA